ncbi:hypothetical protein TEA_024319 [Camellia sinensis var. sinensis]|uniref:Disease resistance R13L4/SHOC-2-like LRR domain-containing protein n=1 Tax=Camellia sinensis var. sinensis TaxID=542762 RepID=A0A4S4E1K4_CAMSN|nr:hypothetical protein TEA_024319 [Camellia sinensis var. sinensis]
MSVSEKGMASVRKQIIDPRDLKIPKHGSVVLGFRHRNVHDIGLVDLEIKMEDHLLLWSLFWKNVDNFPSKIEPIASQLVQLCHNHLLAIILLARALKSVTDVRVWQHALGELASSSFSSLMEGKSREVMVVVLKFVWERKSIVTRHCIKHSCTLVTKDIKLEKTSLLSCWIENDLIETETAGKHVLEDLIKSFLLEKVSEGYVRMREETREVLLKQFIPHLHPLYLKQEGLGLSEAPEVAEWDAKEIYLNNNHLSELPEKPNCPSLVTLFLQENYDLMEIPSSFFRCMPMLQVLDLSRTSIKSLLACISRLVSLQELFLRGGELLMELPLEIGALLKLQVLDLEGTEIMYLPKEISGLKKLECLKVSLYGYGKHYREGKQICKRIPAGLLASLCMLKALSIDVNPDGDEWVADVKDVTNEPLKLEPLMSLKLYLPEVGQLKEITSVRNFKFTVGRHKQCIISCLPHEVEEEFEKLENCLKYINGKYIPIEIQNALKCTRAFFLE